MCCIQMFGRPLHAGASDVAFMSSMWILDNRKSGSSRQIAAL